MPKKSAKCFRFQVKDENETVGKKIRESELAKIPYLLVAGDKEVKNKTINLRSRDTKTQKEITIKEFLELITKL